MSLHCSKCGKNISNTVNFCPYCGTEAPRCTIIAGAEDKEVIDNPRYCPECGKPNITDALYCSDCSAAIFHHPQQVNMFCGKCGMKNSSRAKICISCGMKFSDWFDMKGEIAKELGYAGDLSIIEKMTGITYHFILRQKFTIGRCSNNDLVIPCNWVSGHHCIFNFDKNQLIDSSRNGTYINRHPDKIDSVPASYVNEFNIAGSFTFPVIKSTNYFITHLGAIIDEPDCRRNGDGNVFDQLRKTYYILFKGDFEINIQKFDGVVLDKLKPDSNYYTINLENNRYYYTDKARNIFNKLIVKNAVNLPDNWELINVN
ncbi:MAG: zinc-ribbon domain-containing protein [Candidatus Stygibacter australis]|nr:zinc-ribbon domain-containing protein [Candidatus Stygibacter australis]